MTNNTPDAGGVSRLRSLLPRQTRPLAVLFVDPDIAGAERLASAIRPFSVVAVAPSWQAARAVIELRRPNLIVMELNLPDAVGLELLTSIHGSPTLRHTLIIVATTRADIQSKIAAFEAGADDYLVKPIAAEQFALHVRRLSHFRQVLGGS